LKSVDAVSSTAPASATVPANVVVPPNATSATFVVTTRAVEADATVTITDSEGNRRTATTSSFGVYTFEDVEAGLMRELYDERLLSRLYGGFAVYRFIGEDVRFILNQRRRQART
jgi:hypothetical protein